MIESLTCSHSSSVKPLELFLNGQSTGSIVAYGIQFLLHPLSLLFDRSKFAVQCCDIAGRVVGGSFLSLQLLINQGVQGNIFHTETDGTVCSDPDDFGSASRSIRASESIFDSTGNFVNGRITRRAYEDLPGCGCFRPPWKNIDGRSWPV